MAEKLAKKKKPIFKRWWFWVIAVIVLFALVPTDDAEEGASEADKVPKSAVESKSEEEGAEAVVEEEEAPEEVAEPEPEAPGIGDVVKVGTSKLRCTDHLQQVTSAENTDRMRKVRSYS